MNLYCNLREFVKEYLFDSTLKFDSEDVSNTVQNILFLLKDLEKNSEIISRWDLVDVIISSSSFSDYIDPRCPIIINALQTYVNDSIVPEKLRDALKLDGIKINYEITEDFETY